MTYFTLSMIWRIAPIVWDEERPAGVTRCDDHVFGNSLSRRQMLLSTHLRTGQYFWSCVGTPVFLTTSPLLQYC